MKGEGGGGLKLDRVKNYEEFGLPLTNMKLHKKWRSNRARKVYFKAEVNISPKNSISAQPLKMALHRNPAMHGSRMVIFLHDSKKALF